MLRRIAFLGVALVTVVAACGGKTQTRQRPDDASVSNNEGGGGGGDGIVANECAPNDGPALQLIFNLEPPPQVSCTSRSMTKGQRQLTFYLWGAALPSGPGAITIQSGSASSIPATATVCTQGTSTTTCSNATGGTLTLTSFTASASSAAGSYSVTLANGDKVSGSFSATQCHNATQCG